MSSRRKTAGAKLRELFDRPLFFLFGAFNPLTVLQIQHFGSPAAYVSGAAVATSLGRLDEGRILRQEMGHLVKQMTMVSDLPLIVDCDTGLLSATERRKADRNQYFNEYEAVLKTVQEMERAGAAAVQLEDQMLRKKRCGHLDGKELLHIDGMRTKIMVACAQRRSKDFVIVARTDARSVEGLDGAIQRANYYKDAGADMIFPEALQTVEEFIEFRKQVPGIPLIANFAELGKTSVDGARQLCDAGYQMVLFPAIGIRRMSKVFFDMMREITERGSAERIANGGNIITRDEMNEFLKQNSKLYK
ncbi:MAG: isocitrate lyase/phosphoenolpyruvate mutase family protein [Parcubacteria group bacterium]|nr:isocitrate lyase/phosphoenolpyruvate mutase family protein [Parcubacteria group bacterium]